MKKISVLIVTYNNAKTIEQCLCSVIAQTGDFDLEIIVVDNHSTDQTISLVKKLAVDQLIQNKENFGFGKAVNIGAKISSGDYLLFFNSDAVLNNGALEKLSQFIMADEKIAMVGGKFISPAGRPMVSFGNFPDRFTEFFQTTKIAKFLPYGRYVSYGLLTKKLFSKAHRADWVSGGFSLIRRNIFEAVKGFDENYFLYFEDIDLARKIRALGREIFYCPKAEAVHFQFKSGSLTAKKYEQESQAYYFKKWHQ